MQKSVPLRQSEMSSQPIRRAKQSPQRTIPIAIPIQGEMPKSTYITVDVYAPIPKNAACPNENCPE